MIATLLVFILILLVLVISHEAGHFFSALFFGIKVEEFGFGIPPKLFGIKSKKGILYSFNLLPFGGFVKIFGEDGGESLNPAHFGAKPAWIQAVVLAAGIIMNLVLAYLIFIIVAGLGTYESIADENFAVHQDAKVMIVDIAPGSPAAAANLVAGDEIINVVSAQDYLAVQKVSDVQKFIDGHKGKEVLFSILRGKAEFNKIVIPRANPPAGEGPLGVALELVRIKKISWYQAPAVGAKIMWNAISATVVGLWDIIKNLIGGHANQVQVSGPVGIFNLTFSAKNMGIATLLTFVALLSINLGIINLLPIPGLDGGRLFFLLIESIRGKKISTKTSALVHGIGLALLIFLMLFITFHDIRALF